MDIQSIYNTIINTHYLKALVIFIIAYIAMQVLLFIFEKVFLKLAKKTETKVDDIIVEKTRVPLAFLVLTIGARFASEALEFSETVNGIVAMIFSSLIVIILAHVIIVIFNTLVDGWVDKAISKAGANISKDVIIMIHRFAKILMYLLAFMYVLSIWGIEIGPLLASLGIAGLAVALAIKPTLENIFGGITLIADKVLRAGDIVELDDGSLGTVQKVSLRSTKIKTFDNELITIPNGKLADSKITNWYLPNKKVRVNINFGVEYGSDPNKVKKIVMDIVKENKKIQKEHAPYILFTEMADFSLNFVLRFWIEDLSDKLRVKDEITTKIYKALSKNKIGIPFPTRTVYNYDMNKKK